MIKIRKSIFETNSSSTHSICICPIEDYEKFKNGELFYKNYDDELVTKQKVIDYLTPLVDLDEVDFNTLDTEGFKDLLEELGEREYTTFEGLGFDEYETFENEYTTKKGDKIVAFGFYGGE